MTSSQKEESIPTGKSVEAYRRFLNMKNREYRVLVTLALMASLVVGNVAGTSAEAGNRVEVHRIKDALHGYFALGIRSLHVQESFEYINHFLEGE